MSYLIQKIKTISSLLQHPYFGFIKIKTRGYLSPTVYYKMYSYAKAAPAGHAIDIGPAQGGSSVAIAKGLLKKNKIVDWKVYSIEKGHSSNALSSRNGIDENQATIEQNLKRFNVDSITEVIMKYSDEAFTVDSIPSPISVLCIDADGALDRDFNIFYNHVAPDGVVILDDYEDMVNRHGEKLLVGSEDDIAFHTENHRTEKLADATPLGKELLTYRLVNYMKSVGFLEEKEIVGSNTWFGIKPASAPIFDEEHLEAMRHIRQEIEAEFWNLRAQKNG